MTHIPPVIPPGSVLLMGIMSIRHGLVDARKSFNVTYPYLQQPDHALRQQLAHLQESVEATLREFDRTILEPVLVDYPHLRKGAEELIVEQEEGDDD